MTRRLLLALSAVTAVACHTTATKVEIPLPYYDSAELTPRWSPVLHHIQDFTLTTERGERVTNADLRGRIHVASFIYTRCAAICPLLVRELKKVETVAAQLPGVVLVSYSVTPDEDSPEALAEFGRRQSIDPQRWLLVTGARHDIWRLARQSYFADDPRELEGPAAAGEAFLHTEKVLLVDRELHLRGVYNGTSAFDVEHLIEDLRRLAGA